MYLFVKALALPPNSLILLILIGLVTRKWARQTGTSIAVVGVLALYALSTTFVSSRLMVALEGGIAPPDLTGGTGEKPDAIIVLSAGFTYETREDEPLTVDNFTLERLRHGVRLHHRTGLPLLVTGGRSRLQSTEIAFLMHRTLRRDFGVEAKWVEKRARNTYENALYSAEILKPLGIQSVYVVSHAWHLRRALAAFEAVGLEPTPAPTGFGRQSRIEVLAFLPSAGGLRSSYYAIHEALGLAWYRWSYF